MLAWKIFADSQNYDHMANYAVSNNYKYPTL